MTDNYTTLVTFQSHYVMVPLPYISCESSVSRWELVDCELPATSNIQHVFAVSSWLYWC